MRLVPKPEQLRGMELIVAGRGARLFLKPGAGKTVIVLKAFDILKRKGLVDKLLVLAPLRVITTSWPQDLRKWEDFEHLTYTTIHGDRSEAMNTQADVYLMNVEGLLSRQWVTATGDVTKEALSFLRRGRTMLAVDESTKFAKSSSKRFKVLKKYLSWFTHRVIMTGTPRAKSIEGLFSQCFITDQGDDLGKFITHFRQRYMVPGWGGFGYEPQPDALDRISAKIAPTTLTIEQSEVVPTKQVKITMQFTPEQRAEFKKLSDDFIATIGGSTVMAPNSGVLFGKLRQYAQGALYKEDGTIIKVHDHKLDALETITEELNGDPLFCLVAYKHDVERIRERYGKHLPYIGSGTSAKDGATYCREFAAGNLPILLGHPQSVALGIDGLQESCSNVCWFGLPPSWEQFYQANLRIVRHGQAKEQVMIYQLLMDCYIERSLVAMIDQERDDEATLLKLIRMTYAEDTVTNPTM